MTRILFTTTSTTVGVAEKTLYALTTLLDPKRCEVTGVVSLKPLGAYAEKIAATGIKTQTLGLKGAPSFRLLKDLCAVIRHERPDIVHALMYQAIQLSRLAKRRLGPEAPFRLIS